MVASKESVNMFVYWEIFVCNNILELHYRGDTYMSCKAVYCTKVFLLVMEDLFVLKYRISHCRLIDRLYISSHWNTMVLVCHKKESISFFIFRFVFLFFIRFSRIFRRALCLHLIFVCFSVIYSYNDDISKDFFKSFWELQIDQRYKIHTMSLLKSNQFNSACINIPYENSIFRYLLVFPFE